MTRANIDHFALKIVAVVSSMDFWIIVFLIASTGLMLPSLFNADSHSKGTL